MPYPAIYLNYKPALNLEAMKFCFTLKLFSCLVLFFSGTGLRAQLRPVPQTLHYDKPAGEWLEALPLGNGSLGAMIFGNCDMERIQFNESSLVSGDADFVGSYQPFGDVFLKWGHQEVSNYKRELLMNDGLHHITYQVGKIKYKRTYFISYPDQAMICMITANKPKSLSVGIVLKDAREQNQAVVNGNSIAFTGSLAENGMKYEAILAVKQIGGKLLKKGNGLNVEAADTLLLSLVAGTNFKPNSGRDFLGDLPHQRLTGSLDKLKKQSYQGLLDRHTKDFGTLFNRVRFSLSSSKASIEPTNILFDNYVQAPGNTKMEELLFHYGRYLLISSSRKGGLPANLQGIWNQEMKPAWYAQYTTNINIEMNYWPADLTNLSECYAPFFDWVEQLAAVNRASADSLLKTKVGWLAYNTNNIMAGPSKWRLHRPGSAWLAQHFWEHFAFTRDTAFLKERAYPILKELVSYWKGHLVDDGHGKLISPDGWSPEHGPHKHEGDKSAYPGASYDQQIVYDLVCNYIDASNTLKSDPGFREMAVDLKNRLLGPKIGRWGQLQEWMQDLDDATDQHRHSSHLFAVYPGKQIDRVATPEFAAAASRSLDARGNESTGWATAWRLNIRARLGEGDKAYQLIKSLIRPVRPSAKGEKSGLYGNLFDAHPPFQIDGNFGYTAGVAEMLLQSQAGAIEFLPALPMAWPGGSVSGLKARGDITVALNWSKGSLQKATIRPAYSGTYTFRYGKKELKKQLCGGCTYVADKNLKLSAVSIPYTR